MFFQTVHIWKIKMLPSKTKNTKERNCDTVSLSHFIWNNLFCEATYTPPPPHPLHTPLRLMGLFRLWDLIFKSVLALELGLTIILRGEITLSGEATLSKLFSLFFWKGVYCIKKKIAFHSEQILSFQKECSVQGNKQDVTKVISVVKHGGKSTARIQSLNFKSTGTQKLFQGLFIGNFSNREHPDLPNYF